PVTGSAHCCLGDFWRKRLAKKDFVAYQASARGGVVRVRVTEDRAFLGGRAMLVARGELLVGSDGEWSKDEQNEDKVALSHEMIFFTHCSGISPSPVHRDRCPAPVPPGQLCPRPPPGSAGGSRFVARPPAPRNTRSNGYWARRQRNAAKRRCSLPSCR